MAKITLIDVANLENENTAVAQMAANNAALESALENTLSRDGTLPNVMTGNVDFSGGGRLVNVQQPLTSQEPLRLADLVEFVGGGTISTIPAGGHTGDLLIKNSENDFDVAWQPEAPFEVTAGTNIAITGSVPAVISMPDNPTLTTITNSGILTLPAGPDTLVGRATTDTLTNKTLTAPVLTTPALGTPASGVLTNCTGLPVAGLAVSTSANLASVISDETGSGKLVFATSPALVTPSWTGQASGVNIGLTGNITFTTTGQGLIGTSTNDNALGTVVGEYIESVVPSTSAVSLVNGTSKTITSITLTAGDWDVAAELYFINAATTSVTVLSAFLSLTTNAGNGNSGMFSQRVMPATVNATNFPHSVGIVPSRFSLSTSTTIFLVGNAVFTVSTLTGYGIIRARRMR